MEYGDMQLQGPVANVGFFTGDFDRDDCLKECEGLVDTVVAFNPQTGVIEVHQFVQSTAKLIPREPVKGVVLSGMSVKKKSKGGYSEEDARRVLRKIVPLKNTVTISL